MAKAKQQKAKARPRRGLGGLAKGLTTALGIKPCVGCDKNSKKLDRVSDRLRF